MDFLERDTYLAQLQQALQAAVEEKGSTVLVMGEPGIGKSTLVKQFLKQSENSAIQFIGHCDDLFTPRPLAPLHDIALQHPSIQKIFAEMDGSRHDLFSSISSFLQKQLKPVVLVFEDIHWADEATLDFIKYLSRRVHRLPCIFLLTWRDTEVHSQHPLFHVLGDLPTGSQLRLQLQPLSVQAVEQLAAEKNRQGEHIFRITGGNPFFVQELLQARDGGLPQNIRDAVLLHFNRQSYSVQKAWQLLSLMPEGLEISRLAFFPPDFGEALNESLKKKILQVKNDRLVFRHELFRLAIASTLTSLDAGITCRDILHRLLPSFMAQKEWTRIVHYAREAGNSELVLMHAPRAAAAASATGAHAESVKLYKEAIEHAGAPQQEGLLSLYESYAYECYLTSQFDEAIAYTEKALHMYEQKGEKENLGKSLRFLSRLWWFQGNRAISEGYALRAIEVLKDQPLSSIKAMAYSNLSQLYMLQKKKADCLHWGEQAIAMALQLNDQETLSHALNNTGSVQLKNMDSLEPGKSLLEKSLRIALEKGLEEHAARAYTNLISISIAVKEYEVATHYMAEGLQYCEDRDLDSWTTYKLSWKARLLMERGEWTEALSLALKLLGKPQAPIVKIGVLVIAAVVHMRQDKAPVIEWLEEARRLAFATEEHQRIMPVMTAMMEWEWLSGNKIIKEEEIDAVTNVLETVDDPFQTSEFAFWLRMTGRAGSKPSRFRPYQLLENGQVSAAADFWMKKGCAYDAALALYQGNEAEKKKALEIVQQLQATATIRRMQQEMQAAGIRKIPRGRRSSTLQNPAQLTSRELEVLQLLHRSATNKEISAALFISPKTVDHHISSILFKLEAVSRTKAVARAREMGMI